MGAIDRSSITVEWSGRAVSGLWVEMDAATELSTTVTVSVYSSISSPSRRLCVRLLYSTTTQNDTFTPSNFNSSITPPLLNSNANSTSTPTQLNPNSPPAATATAILYTFASFPSAGSSRRRPSPDGPKLAAAHRSRCSLSPRHRPARALPIVFSASSTPVSTPSSLPLPTPPVVGPVAVAVAVPSSSLPKAPVADAQSTAARPQNTPSSVLSAAAGPSTPNTPWHSSRFFIDIDTAPALSPSLPSSPSYSRSSVSFIFKLYTSRHTG